ncbi:MAG: ferrochelatase [Acidimicrobiales bacterium]
MTAAAHPTGPGRTPVGVLVMSYGTPGGPDEVAGYYTHVRRGRPPTPALLADLEARYRAIGGVSPLAERTRAQAAGLQAALDRRRAGAFQVFVGAKHAPPFIEDAVAAMAGAGLRRAVGLVLAPHYSSLSVGEYQERARAAGRQAGIEVTPVDSWHLAPGLIALLADRLTATLAGLPAGVTAGVTAGVSAGVTAGVSARVSGAAEVLVTAHSLPERILADGDPYPDQLRETAEAVTSLAGVSRWRLAWQSAGRTPEPWIGPDILEVIRDLPAEGVRAVVVCPAGFTSDHLEVLYDVDIEARRLAEDLGLVLARTPSLNDDPKFMATLAKVVVDALPPEGTDG